MKFVHKYDRLKFKMIIILVIMLTDWYASRFLNSCLKNSLTQTQIIFKYDLKWCKFMSAI